MPKDNNCNRFKWRKDQHPSSRHHEQPPAEAGDGFGAGHLFQGMRHDPEQAKLFGFANRAFDPGVKPWADQEPPPYVDGMNAYVAMGDNPINAVNPLGA